MSLCYLSLETLHHEFKKTNKTKKEKFIHALSSMICLQIQIYILSYLKRQFDSNAVYIAGIHF